jgi:hypothetical protein
MNKIFLSLVCVSLLYSCGNNNADQPVTDKDSAEVTARYSWEATLNDSSERLEMKKIENSGPDSIAPTAIITYLNTNNSNIQLEFMKSSNDTVYLKIPEATFLTQQMGSTGPTLFFANAVFNLTEIPGIKYVTFDFEEGDHASPGTFSRESFKDE